MEVFENKLIEENDIECSKVVVAIIDSGVYSKHEYFSEERIFDGGFARVDDETGESFPSLEDEPTNMNMGGMNMNNDFNNQPGAMPQQPVMPPQQPMNPQPQIKPNTKPIPI